MSIEKIKESDLLGKGVVGMPDVPGLTAEEMQRKVEEIVREVAIAKINEIITYILEEGASKKDIENLVLNAGAVTSVFGRTGNVAAKAGDYSPAMVGAAAKEHSANHKTGGSDPIAYSDIGAAAESHPHGNITAEGKIGNLNGMVIVTGSGGKLEAKSKTALGFELAPENVDITEEFTAAHNKVYLGNGISNFIFNCDGAKAASCRGWVTFGATVGTVALNGFDFIDDPEDITSAEANSRWEFDLEKGCLIIRKRSA